MLTHTSTEMDFMAHRVQLLINSLLAGLLFMTVSCNTNDAEVNKIPDKVINADTANISILNGLFYQNKNLFSGTLVLFYKGTNDTAEITKYLFGTEHGEWKKYYPNKRLKEKRFFTNGTKTGEYIAWWENGKKQLDYFFVADEYEGTCKEWNKEGFLNKIMNYKKGHEEGHQQWWYDNGRIKANYVIKDGRRFGLLGTKNCINVSDSIFKN